MRAPWSQEDARTHTRSSRGNAFGRCPIVAAAVGSVGTITPRSSAPRKWGKMRSARGCCTAVGCTLVPQQATAPYPLESRRSGGCETRRKYGSVQKNTPTAQHGSLRTACLAFSFLLFLSDAQKGFLESEHTTVSCQSRSAGGLRLLMSVVRCLPCCVRTFCVCEVWARDFRSGPAQGCPAPRAVAGSGSAP